jgi:hypothetical protein
MPQCLWEDKPFFADLPAEYMEFRRDRLLSSLNGELMRFAMVCRNGPNPSLHPFAGPLTAERSR